MNAPIVKLGRAASFALLLFLPLPLIKKVLQESLMDYL